MKKLLFTCLMLVVFNVVSYATHISGGELYYEYVGPGDNNTDRYMVTMRLFRECGPVGPNFAGLDGENVTIGIYSNNGLTLVTTRQLTQQFSGTPPIVQNTQGANPCLLPFINVCYQIGTWRATIDLPKTAEGYTLSWIRYTRTAITNVSNPSSQMGATFTTKIPGTNQLPIGNNNCPKFAVRDTNTVCISADFILDFSATDADGDSLAYKLSPAYDGQNGPNPNPSPAPPQVLSPTSLVYPSPYSPTNPFGTGATINEYTGIIKGIAPPVAGKYVVCVTVEEWRDGVLINEHRKDMILRVANCSTVKPDAGPDDRTCDGLTYHFENQSPNASIISYLWNFGDGNTSTAPTPTYTYTDTGKFLIMLKVTATGGCQDSSYKYVYVYPGFKPGITVQGSCVVSPIKFFDATTTVYGVVNTWNWNFGDLTTTADTAINKDSSWLFPSSGTYTVTLQSGNSKGCLDTVTKVFTVRDLPIINLPFKDTLICSIDTLPLIANTTGNITWTPNYNILNANSANPLVYPKDTTTYVVTVNDDGCISKDSITVNVLDFITVNAGADSTVCLTDEFRLNPNSHALSYIWTASTGEVVAPEKYPLVKPTTTTQYYVTANLGKCQDKDSVLITTIPYPQAQINTVPAICYGDSIKLTANIVGSTFSWLPTTDITNEHSLTPTVKPAQTTYYYLTANDTLGCPKPTTDSVLIEVIPKVEVFAGNDTAVVRNQPLQLNTITSTIPIASIFHWTPSTGLNNPSIANPTATLNINTDSIKYKVVVTRPEGCKGEDEIVVKIFKTQPDIFIPTAFTPNNDGKNDILKPIPVGITRIDFFRIYNRLGQLIYETKEYMKGWDGNVGGVPQASGTYVFAAQGVDYTGKIVFKKGTVVLIR
ncbi:MAG: gliding motility-associated C-terminal domain-containing protein [Chitinophagaceae bacterium]|nr:gliding motility-associated C-terminal domain-containing protein [Chitinophagaceae bacterium]MCW5904951.1 gliding motility-associated C-terminal domain-containing protein [Chitinophagaceae bacterium]